MDLRNIVSEYLRDAADNIQNNSCGLTEEEIQDLIKQLMHIELNKTEAAEYLGMSTRTFDRKIENGELPVGQHVRGSKNLIWYKDELIRSLGE